MAPRFYVGQVVHHLLYDYRGVIVEAHPTFQGTQQWYEQVAQSIPPKDRPWYRVLVHEATHETYVAERNLEPDTTGEQIDHPMLPLFFDEFRGDRYVLNRMLN